MRLEKVVAPAPPMQEEETPRPVEKIPAKDNVISFDDFKKE